MIEDLVATALLGTARMPPALAGLDAGAAAETAESDPAAQLLTAAALEFAFEKASAGTSVAVVPAPAADDERLLLPRAASHRLAELLATRSALLPEWFAVARARGFRAPAAQLASLLTSAQALPEHRADLVALAGPRGLWLAAQNPEWMEFVPYTPADTAPWTHGSTRERRRWLADVRRVDPAAARVALTATWEHENASDKATFVALFELNPQPEDEPLLQVALTDTRRDVRDAAAKALRRHPESEYVRTLVARAHNWQNISDGTEITTIAATVPLSVWSDVFGSPTRAIDTTVWTVEFLDGWADAAVAQHDSQWADLLLPHRPRTVATAASPAAIVHHVRSLATDALTEQPNLFAALPHPWPSAAVDHFLRLVLQQAGQAAAELRRTRANSPAAAAPALRPAAAHMPVDAVAKLRVLAQHCPDQSWGRALHNLGQDLITRTTMLEELL